MDLVTEFRRLMPKQFAAISSLLGYEQQRKLARHDHLLSFYDRMVFFTFMSCSRVKNPRTFVWWGVINSAARYGLLNSNSHGHVAVHVGLSLTQSSLMLALSPTITSLPVPPSSSSSTSSQPVTLWPPIRSSSPLPP